MSLGRTIGLLLAAAAFTLLNHMLIAGVISLTQAQARSRNPAC